MSTDTSTEADNRDATVAKSAVAPAAKGTRPDGRAERRRKPRDADNMSWEGKVLGRLGNRLDNLPKPEEAPKSDTPSENWESSVLDVLRRRIEQSGR